MSHEFETGFFTREGAWHNLGTVVREAPTVEEGIKLAGLDWRVDSLPVFAMTGDPTNPATVGMSQADGFRAQTRSTDGKVLGITGERFEPLQNVDAFAFFDHFLAQGHTLEAAGSLQEGRTVWILAKLNGLTASIGNSADTVGRYLLLAHGHDGKRSIRIKETDVRTVCMNTLEAAMADGRESHSIRHTSGAKNALAATQRIIDNSHENFRASVAEWESMTGKPVTADTLDAYIQATFKPAEQRRAAELERAAALAGFTFTVKGTTQDAPEKVDPAQEAIVDEMLAAAATAGTPSASNMTASVNFGAAMSHRSQGEQRDALVAAMALAKGDRFRHTDKVVELFHNGPGADMAGSTVWGAYNAVTNYLNHHKGRNDETRANATWFGSGADSTPGITARAHEKALILAGV